MDVTSIEGVSLGMTIAAALSDSVQPMEATQMDNFFPCSNSESRLAFPLTDFHS